MLKDSKTWNKIKPTHEQTSLDSLYLSGTNGEKCGVRVCPVCSDVKKVARKERLFPDHDRWYTLTFRDFAEKCLEVGYSFLGVDFAGEVTTASGKLRPRWSEYYQEVTRARIYKWAEALTVLQGSAIQDSGHISTDKAHFVTLTVRHDVGGSYRSMRETVEALRASWEGVRRRVNRSGWHYLRVMEPGGENGYPHYHMIIVGAEDQEIEEFVQAWLRACNKRGNAASRKGQNWQRAENIRNVGAYVVKYLSKSFKPEEVGRRDALTWWRWMELCYREGVRTYAMDQLSGRYIRKCYPGKLHGVGCMEFVTDVETDYLEEPEELPELGVVQRPEETRAGECPPCGGMQSAYPAGASVGRSPSGTAKALGKQIEDEVLGYG